jgi:hypothetical protein
VTVKGPHWCGLFEKGKAMSDITLASSVASTPNAAKYEDPNFEPNVKKAAIVLDEAALNRRFDGHMHAHMNAAKTDADWDRLFAVLVNAHNNGNLRANVRDRFLKVCPHQAKKDSLGSVTKPAQKSVDVDALNKRFDDRMRSRMESASNGEWKSVRSILISAHQNGNLRAEIANAFVNRCPLELLKHFHSSTGNQYL